mmetsp:Transcript_12401/g.26791  ORF Transcript_12401/g.26791 Transcript_12401/m.26791 type:complete len:249 (-) Transcript_12401:1065-1811(-)
MHCCSSLSKHPGPGGDMGTHSLIQSGVLTSFALSPAPHPHYHQHQRGPGARVRCVALAVAAPSPPSLQGLQLVGCSQLVACRVVPTGAAPAATAWPGCCACCCWMSWSRAPQARALSAAYCACVSANSLSREPISAARSFWKRFSSSVMRLTMVSYAIFALRTLVSASDTSLSASTIFSSFRPGVPRSLASLTFLPSRSPLACTYAPSAVALSATATCTQRMVRLNSFRGASKVAAITSARWREATEI